MRPSSCKAKGRRLQQQIVADLYARFPALAEGDLRSTSMGCGGEDIQMSPAAREVIPFSIEAKNQVRTSPARVPVVAPMNVSQLSGATQRVGRLRPSVRELWRVDAAGRDEAEPPRALGSDAVERPPWHARRTREKARRARRRRLRQARARGGDTPFARARAGRSEQLELGPCRMVAILQECARAFLETVTLRVVGDDAGIRIEK